MVPANHVFNSDHFFYNFKLDAGFGDKNEFFDSEEIGWTSSLALSNSMGSTLHLRHILKDEISPLRSQ